MTEKEISAKLKAAAQAYYEGEGVLTDEEFDQLKDDYVKLTGKKFEVGYTVGGKNKVKHNFDLVGTEGKVNTFDEFKKWSELRQSQSKITLNPTYYTSVKMDGLSVCMELYSNGKVMRCVTRGDGIFGIDITHLFVNYDLKALYAKYIEGDIPDMAVTFEAIISWENYNYIKENYPLKGTNPRSMLAGIFARLRGDSDINDDITSRIELVPLRYILDGEENPILPLKDNDTTIHQYRVFTDVSALEQYYTDIILKRDSFGYMIDGIVIEILDDAVRDLGKHDGERKFSVALKFPYLEKVTRVTGMRYDFNGVSGRITPVVQFEPIIINGNTYQFVSLANKKRFDEMRLAKGEELIFELRNDVLGYVHKKDPNFYDPTNEIGFIKTCPICGSELKEDENYSFCDFKYCDGVKKGKIFNFLSKLGVEGVAEETISKLYDDNVIAGIEDLYDTSLDTIKEKILTVEGFKTKSADIFIKAVSKKIFKVSEGDLLGALNIPSISTTKANLICEHFSLLDIINKNITEDEFTKINGLGKQTYIILMDAMNSDNISIINTVINKGYLLTNSTRGVVTTGDIKKVVFTGSVIGYKNRKEYEEFLEVNGYKLASGVSKDTYCLICNEKTSSSSKTVKAKQLNIPMLTQEEFKIQENL